MSSDESAEGPLSLDGRSCRCWWPRSSPAAARSPASPGTGDGQGGATTVPSPPTPSPTSGAPVTTTGAATSLPASTAPGEATAPGATTAPGREHHARGHDDRRCARRPVRRRRNNTAGVSDDEIVIGIHAPVTGASPIPQTSFDVGKDIYWKFLADSAPGRAVRPQGAGRVPRRHVQPADRGAGPRDGRRRGGVRPRRRRRRRSDHGVCAIRRRRRNPLPLGRRQRDGAHRSVDVLRHDVQPTRSKPRCSCNNFRSEASPTSGSSCPTRRRSTTRWRPSNRRPTRRASTSRPRPGSTSIRRPSPSSSPSSSRSRTAGSRP